MRIIGGNIVTSQSLLPAKTPLSYSPRIDCCKMHTINTLIWLKLFTHSLAVGSWWDTDGEHRIVSKTLPSNLEYRTNGPDGLLTISNFFTIPNLAIERTSLGLDHSASTIQPPYLQTIVKLELDPPIELSLEQRRTFLKTVLRRVIKSAKSREFF